MIHTNQNVIRIGHRIRAARKLKGISQEALASELDVSVNYIGEIERGKRPVSLNMAEKFCHYFDLTLDYLYRGNDLEIPEEPHPGVPDPHSELTHLIDTCSEQELRFCLCIIRPLLTGCRTLSDSPRPQSRPDKRSIWNDSRR